MDKRLSSRERKARSGDKEAKAEVALITKLLPHLNEGNPALTFESQLDDDERKLLHSFQLLSDKKASLPATSMKTNWRTPSTIRTRTPTSPR